MEWHTQPDGVLQREANGVLLSLDPWRRCLSIRVTDYHSTPVDIDLDEILDPLIDRIRPTESRAPATAPSASPVWAFLKRHTPAFLAGALTSLVFLHSRRR